MSNARLAGTELATPGGSGYEHTAAGFDTHPARDTHPAEQAAARDLERLWDLARSGHDALAAAAAHSS